MKFERKKIKGLFWKITRADEELKRERKEGKNKKKRSSTLNRWFVGHTPYPGIKDCQDNSNDALEAIVRLPEDTSNTT